MDIETARNQGNILSFLKYICIRKINHHRAGADCKGVKIWKGTLIFFRLQEIVNGKNVRTLRTVNTFSFMLLRRRDENESILIRSEVWSLEMGF